MAIYTKLRDGSWGVRVQGSASTGQTVTVTKKSGETKTETIARILWAGNGITLCSINQHSNGYRRSGHASGTYAPGGRRCDYCGSRECPRAWNPLDLCDDD